MNTPAHAVVNLLVLDRPDRPGLAFPVAAGALLPDLPMVVFYAWEKLVRAVPERVIWSESYYDPTWQAFIDVFNSLPIIAACAVTARLARAPRAMALFASMALHALLDLPFHHDDAHRHFFPLTDWRFESPISYWDPRHYGDLFALFEVLVVLAGCIALARRYRSRTARGLVAGVACVYFAYLGYALLVWV